MIGISSLLFAVVSICHSSVCVFQYVRTLANVINAVEGESEMRENECGIKALQ